MSTGTTYTSAADDAAAIRAAYKRLGWTTRDVSVRCKNYSGGSSVHVSIKAPKVRELEAERIARNVAEQIRRDERTGDILRGGNRFVSVGYSTECKRILARRHWDALEEALGNLPDAPTTALEPIAGTEHGDDSRPVYVGWRYRDAATLWLGHSLAGEFYAGSEAGREEGAFQLARLLNLAAEK